MGKFKYLAKIDIDGTTYAINTDYKIYTVPTNYNAIAKILINNRSTSDATIRLYHLANGDTESPPDVSGNIFYDEFLLKAGTNDPAGKAWATIEMDEGDMIYFRSDTTNVNIMVRGLERLSK